MTSRLKVLLRHAGSGCKKKQLGLYRFGISEPASSFLQIDFAQHDVTGSRKALETCWDKLRLRNIQK